MSVNIVFVTRWLQKSRNEEKSYLPNQKKPKRELGKYTNIFPAVQKAKSSAEVQWMLLLYFKFYFRAILKKACKHPLFYICNL